ncbi:MAG: hypothetical protein H8E46_00450 [FCB group bacterium]|nr:hypothetical protein [FCB group bacterium]
MKWFSLSYLVVLTVMVLVMFPRDAHAYIDPGSGFIMLQVLLAGVVGGFFVFKNFWLNLFRRKKPESDEKKEDSSIEK